MPSSDDQLEQRVEGVLAASLPAVDLLELTVLPTGGGMLRLVVDHPDGVDHDVCAAVTEALGSAGLLEEHGAEVWSPGPEPPLRLPRHFAAAVGRRVRIRVEGDGTVSGTLVSADDDGVGVETAEGVVAVPFGRIRRAHAVEEVGAW
ncbi:MAG: ribosome maturation factor RimP [Thermoleophilia bacterium]